MIDAIFDVSERSYFPPQAMHLNDRRGSLDGR
jgi:hypothetical protein